MSVKNIIAGLIDLGVSYDDLMEALEDQKPKKSNKKAGKEKASKADKKGSKKTKKNEPELLADLSDKELKGLAEDLELASPKKLKKMDREELIDLLSDEDEDELEDLIEELFGDDSDDDSDDDEDEDDSDDEDEEDEDDDTDFYEMSHDELIEEVVKRGLAKKAKAKKMDEDELIDILEDND